MTSSRNLDASIPTQDGGAGLVVQQTIFKDAYPNIKATFCSENQLSDHITVFLKSLRSTGGALGIAASYGDRGLMTAIALASTTEVLVVTLLSNKERRDRATSKENPLTRKLLCASLVNVKVVKYAFHMDKIASGLYGSCRLTITAAKDLLSLSTASRGSFQAMVDVLGGEAAVNKPAVFQLFFGDEISDADANDAPPTTIALQAWAAVVAGSMPAMKLMIDQLPSISTVKADSDTLLAIAKAIQDVHCIANLWPLRVKNEVAAKSTHRGIHVQVTSERFKTRLTPTAYHQVVELTVVDPDGTSRVITGKVPRTDGKVATISLRGKMGDGQVESIETVGRERQGHHQRLRTMFLLAILQGILPVATYPFFQAIWPEKKKINWDPLPQSWEDIRLIDRFNGRLNRSQARAVEKILSNDDNSRIVLVHGPPGTGKTTVIAASTMSIVNASQAPKRTVWLVAQSNVAVKNIAEKLVSEGFCDFKVLISKEFHHEWHEHLYDKIEANLIRSDSFVDDLVHTEGQLEGVRVVLCTLTMLSSERLDKYTQHVPVETVIFDEASQIELGEYLCPVIRFRPTLRKLVFIGDRRQLAPYGSSDIPSLDTIFKKPRLVSDGVFLDTQYRLPVPLGNFISEQVYGGKLKSQHDILDQECCHFVDVKDGVEEFENRSLKNMKEVETVTKIAHQLSAKGLSFRIITPYDLQRSLLEGALKGAGLSWENKCFNIDSFQGNEDDYIIISLVRTQRIGFLQDKRRMNVMLTRCKIGMIVCANRNFLQSKVGSETLVGKMVKAWNDPWLTDVAEIFTLNTEAT